MESKKRFSLIIIAILLALAGIVCEILGSIQWMKWLGYSYVSPELIAYIIVCIATIYYVSVGYKKPHGNLLRLTFLLLALLCINGIIDIARSLYTVKDFHVTTQLIMIGLYGVSVLLISYVAGRLDKIKKNTVPLVIITAAQIAIPILCIFIYNNWSNIVFIVYNFSTFLLWIDLMIAYIIRYIEHKEAGLVDKK